MGRRYAILEAPSILGLKPTGVERVRTRCSAAALPNASALAGPAGSISPAYQATRDPQTRTLNAAAMAAWSPWLADAVEAVLHRGEFPVVLGGDCSILLGTTLALKRRGRYGLLFIDGHADFYQPEANPNGEAASMELAFVTGRGPKLLTDLEGREPLVRDEDVVALGVRDAAEQARYGSQPLAPGITAIICRRCDAPVPRRRRARRWRILLAPGRLASSSISTLTACPTTSCRRSITAFLTA